MTAPSSTAASSTGTTDLPGFSQRPAAYRLVALGMAVVFAAVGLLFLCLPGGVLRFFDSISPAAGFEPSPAEGGTLYTVLAAAYMYLVTLFAWGMYRRPENPAFPALLANAKLASSVLSLVLFFMAQRALVLLVNGVVDGVLGAGVLMMYLRWKERT